MLEFLNRVHDLLTNDNTVRSPDYIFSVVLLSPGPPWPWLTHSVSFSLLSISERVQSPCSPGSCGYCCQAHKSDCMFDKLKLGSVHF